MTRKAIAVADDGGFYHIAPGAAPGPWPEVRDLIEYEYPMGPAEAEVDTEHLLGWDRWTWGILVDGICVAFVDGDGEPTDLPFGPR